MVLALMKKFDQLYEREKYDECHKIIKSILNDIRACSDTHDVMKNAELNDICYDMPVEGLAILLESNEIVLRGMKLFDSHGSDSRQQWNTLCHLLINHYTKVKALNPLNHPPHISYLNTVYSILWLETMKHKNHCSFDQDYIFQILFDCLKRVLLLGGERPCFNSGGCKELSRLLSQTINCLLNLQLEHCLLVIEICLLSIHLLLEFSDVSSKLIKDVIFKLNEMWPLIHIKVKKSEKVITKKKRVKMVKFGLFKLNDVADTWHLEKTGECVSVLSSLSFIRMGCTAESLNFIEDETHTSPQFLRVYLKAFCYFHLRETESCLLNLSYASQAAKSIPAQVHTRLLKGEMLSSLRKYSSAHDEYMSALQSNHYCYRILHHMLNNLQRSLHANFEERGMNFILKDSLSALHFIYKFLKNCDYTDNNEDCNIESKLFCYLTNNREIHKEDILYLIGEELLWIMQVCNDLLETSRSTSNIAAECFLDIFESRSSRQYSRNSFSLLPSDQILLQETTTALLLAGQVEAAETVCDVALVYSEKKTESETTEEEQFLKGNIAVMMLMACIKILRYKREEAVVYLRRCKTVIIESYFGTASSKKILLSSIFDLVASRVYLLTALLQWRSCCFVDAKRSFQRAIVHNPDDAVILTHCSTFEKETHMDVAVSKITNRNAHNSFNPKNCKTATLRYLLTGQLPL